jgi:hypothetical protein
MFCRLKNFRPAIWLIPFLVITGFWARSYRRSDHFHFVWKKQVWELNSADGKFSIDNQPEVAAQQTPIEARLDWLRKLSALKEKDYSKVSSDMEALLNESIEMPHPKVAKPPPVPHRFYIQVVPNLTKPTNRPLKIPHDMPQEGKDLEQKYAEGSARLDRLFLDQMRILDEESKLHHKMAFVLVTKLGLSGQAQSVALPPPWLLAVVSLILPILRYRRRLIYRSRMRKGLCIACGYDMRSTPARCPECGTVAVCRLNLEFNACCKIGGPRRRKRLRCGWANGR